MILALHAEDRVMQGKAFEAPGKIRHPDAVDSLIPLLHDKTYVERDPRTSGSGNGGSRGFPRFDREAYRHHHGGRVDTDQGTPERLELGKMLYFDPRLSESHAISLQLLP